MHAFISIEIPKDLKTVISKIQDEFKEDGADLKLVSPENLHITPRFLGGVSEQDINKIMEVTGAQYKLP